MLELVNLLFIPVLSLHIQYRRQNKPLEKSVSTLCDYAIWVVADLIACAVSMIILKKAVGIGPTPDSLTYSIINFVFAIILPYLHEIIRKYFEINVEIKKRHDDK